MLIFTNTDNVIVYLDNYSSHHLLFRKWMCVSMLKDFFKKQLYWDKSYAIKFTLLECTVEGFQLSQSCFIILQSNLRTFLSTHKYTFVTQIKQQKRWFGNKIIPLWTHKTTQYHRWDNWWWLLDPKENAHSRGSGPFCSALLSVSLRHHLRWHTTLGLPFPMSIGSVRLFESAYSASPKRLDDTGHLILWDYTLLTVLRGCLQPWVLREWAMDAAVRLCATF